MATTNTFIIPPITNKISNIAEMINAKLGIKICNSSISMNTKNNTIMHIIRPFLVTILSKNILMIVLVPNIASAKRINETTIIENTLSPKISDMTNMIITNFMQSLYHTHKYNAINIKGKMNNN